MSNSELRTYIQYNFSDGHREPPRLIAARLHLIDIPKNADSYLFFDNNSYPTLPEFEHNQCYNMSGNYYVDGKVIPIADIDTSQPQNAQLIKTMTSNNLNYAVQTRSGKLVPLYASDEVRIEGKPIYPDDEKYPRFYKTEKHKPEEKSWIAKNPLREFFKPKQGGESLART